MLIIGITLRYSIINEGVLMLSNQILTQFLMYIDLFIIGGLINILKIKWGELILKRQNVIFITLLITTFVTSSLSIHFAKFPIFEFNLRFLAPTLVAIFMIFIIKTVEVGNIQVTKITLKNLKNPIHLIESFWILSYVFT
jgi:hypothetical protein